MFAVHLSIHPCFHEVTVVRKIVTQSECILFSLPSLRENRDELCNSIQLYETLNMSKATRNQFLAFYLGRENDCVFFAKTALIIN